MAFVVYKKKLLYVVDREIPKDKGIPTDAMFVCKCDSWEPATDKHDDILGGIIEIIDKTCEQDDYWTIVATISGVSDCHFRRPR